MNFFIIIRSDTNTHDGRVISFKEPATNSCSGGHGASLLLALAVGLVFAYLGERGAGNTAEMLFTADTVWYAP